MPALLFAAAAQTLGLAAIADITGTVTDRTTGHLAAGDTVSLISFGNGMQVAATTKTDAQGKYTLPVAMPGMHLVRVDHQKAAYFQPAPPNTSTVDVDVYDVSETVRGVVTEADVLTLQTAPSGELHVTEDFFVRNPSKPPRTQFSDHAYEFYLPKGAKVEGAAAAGPQGMPIATTPVPLAGEEHYTFIFPIRPGQTRFQISYTLPYSGTLAWSQREALATENLVVLLPKSMQFQPKDTDWKPVPVNPSAQTFVRKGNAANKPVLFTISGTGQLPRDVQGQGDDAQAAAPPTVENRPGGGIGVPIDTPDPLHRYKGWLLGGLAILLAAAAAWLGRGGKPDEQKTPGIHPALQPTPLPAGGNSLLNALEQALLTLERERALGTVPEDEYLATHAALQSAMERALRRQADTAPTFGA